MIDQPNKAQTKKQGEGGGGADRDEEQSSYQVVILGGGAAGIEVARLLSEEAPSLSVAIVDPSENYYEQPRWLDVGSGRAEKSETHRDEASVIPDSVAWIQQAATSIEPKRQSVALEDGSRLQYDYLVVAVGIHPQFDGIRGLKDAIGEHGICSLYGFDRAEQVWNTIEQFEGGTAIFTSPEGPFKGAQTPIEIMHRAADYWEEKGLREHTKLVFATARSQEFGGAEYARMVKEDNASDTFSVWFDHELIGVRPEIREAVFRVANSVYESQRVVQFDFLHVVPPMLPPEVVTKSNLAVQSPPLQGLLDVDSNTLRHYYFSNVFAAGDVTSLKVEKTSENAREQAQKIAGQIMSETNA